MTLVADNRDRGTDVEDVACERWPLEVVANGRGEWCDLEFVDDVVRAPAGTIAETDAPVEVKSCVDEYHDRAGRWWIARGPHEQLLEAGGWYVLAVVDRETEAVRRMSLARAREVDQLIDGHWYDCGDGAQTVEENHKLRWTALFRSLERPDGGGGGG